MSALGMFLSALIIFGAAFLVIWRVERSAKVAALIVGSAAGVVVFAIGLTVVMSAAFPA